MSPTALVLVAAVAHALWNLAARTANGDGGHFVFLYVVESTVIWTPVTAVWWIAHRPELVVAVGDGGLRPAPRRTDWCCHVATGAAT